MNVPAMPRPRSAPLFTALLLALLPLQSAAQTVVVARVVDADGQPVPFATVQLRARADSALVGATMSNAQGSFTLEAELGTYRIHISRIGYRATTSDAFTVSGGARLQLPPLVLTPEAVALEGVSVQSIRGLYQQRADRLVINVGGSPTLSGASALQVLERSPGVVVNKASGTISMIGKDGVRVLVNGKLSYIPADGLVQYLAGVSADNLERIELVTAPPADLDAEGNAGYVNLVLKRSPDDGLHGSLTASGGYGEGEVGNASANLNYRRGRTSIFGTYSFLWRAQRQLASNYRRIVNAGKVTEMPATTERDPVQRNHDIRLGLEHRVTDRTTLGGVIAAFDNRWSMHALNRLSILDGGTPITHVDSDNDEVNHWRHAMVGLNVAHELGRGSTMRADLDYLRFGNDNPTTYHNTSTDVASGRATRQQVESGKTTPLGILVAKADFTRARDGWELGAGVKGAFSRFTNETSLRGVTGEQWVSEMGFGDRSRLREDVLAAYGSVNHTPSEATTLKLGLRYEITDSNLGSDRERNLVDRRFGSLFPSVSLSHKLGKDYQLDASYTRRITRPSFRDMAPFLYFFDPQTFFSGNAALQPALTSTLKLDGTYRSLLASLQYAWEDSTIARFQSRFLPEHRIHVMFPANFRGSRWVTGTLALPADVTPWWNAQSNVLATWHEVDSFRNDLPVVLTSTSYRLNSTHKVTLPHDFTFEASGVYQSATLLGANRVGATWQVNVGLQTQLANGGRVTLTVNDLFDSYEWKWKTGAPGDALYIDTNLDFWWRTVSLAYSTSFGGGKAAGRRATASDEERGRVQP